MILLSLFGATIVGALLLALPMSRIKDVPFMDLLFTSASLTTVTGILTVPLDHFSDIGHIIMLILIQLGGLGLMTLSLLFMYMFTNLGVYTQVVASEVLSIK
jgi:trk system potassium uptake protein TrkH